jgi:branched-chain amino acid transport system permease protein
MTWRRFTANLLLGGKGSLVVPLALAAVVALYPWISGGDGYWIRQLALIACFAMVVSGLNLSFGYAGEIQFGQVFMFALGAYASSIVAIRLTAEILPLMVLSAVLATAVGALVAFPALRIGGWSLAMASFFLVLTIPNLADLTDEYSGGLNGLAGIPVPELFGSELSINALYVLTILMLVAWLACYRNLVTSRYGVLFRVMRESRVLASSLGYSPRRLKLLAYTLGALPAGVAGCLFAFQTQFLSPETFGLVLVIGVVAASVLGGVESVYGAILGAAVIQLGPQSSLALQEYAPVGYGLFLIVAAVLFRRGLSGIGTQLARRVSLALDPTSNGRAVVTAGSDLPAEAGLARERVLERRGALLESGQGERLMVRSVSKSYGGVHALRGVSLTAEPGQVTGLIGSNGSGKTTLLNAICGYLELEDGVIELGEGRLSGRPPHTIANFGVARTFQTPSIPHGVSVADVVASGRYRRERCGVGSSIFRLPHYWASRRRDREEALAYLDFIGLAHLADDEAGSLSLGMRRLVETVRALCDQPKLLLLDEPASGLSEEEVERLGDVIRVAADAGTTVLLVEHNFSFVTRIADVVHALHAGELIASGPAATIGDDQRVVDSYLGPARGRPLTPVAASEKGT